MCERETARASAEESERECEYVCERELRRGKERRRGGLDAERASCKGDGWRAETRQREWSACSIDNGGVAAMTQ